ncbi:hypothetical protein [Neobacillus niacini]|uniref:hypothetical protein n=1 Tax=Neobacillus niacini TaxID=86668 RepID=UPI00203B5955|nr:hypothetical protein [Neobacillus niacini]MCM3690716.1 hypothetical protein [Neobacillus niacini]
MRVRLFLLYGVKEGIFVINREFTIFEVEDFVGGFWMKFILIFGPQAVGKMTVGQE